jgi:DNA-binding XRE family transcriptional regulator
MPNKINKRLSKQTDGEKLWVDRTRLKKTQAQSALILGISERTYHSYERDKVEYPWVPPPTTTRSGLLCALARRRDGRPLRQLAKVLKAGSHVTLLKWESQDDPRLVEAWKKQGYIF